MANNTTTVLESRLRRSVRNDPSAFRCPFTSRYTLQCGCRRAIDHQPRSEQQRLQQATDRLRADQLYQKLEHQSFHLGLDGLTALMEELVGLSVCPDHNLTGDIKETARALLEEMRGAAPTIVTRAGTEWGVKVERGVKEERIAVKLERRRVKREE